MPLARSGTTRSPKGSTGTAGVKAPAAAKAPPLQAPADPASLEQRLQRARLLGHRPEAIAAAAGAPPTPPRPVPAVGGPGGPVANLLRSAVADRIQRAIGFELELQVLLTSGLPVKPPEKDEFPVSLEDLQLGKVAPRKQVLQARHTVVLKDGSVYAWDGDSTQEADKERVIRPANLEAEKGRWIRVEVSKEKDRFFDPLLKKEDKVHADDLLEVVEDHAGLPIHPERHLSSIVELVTAHRDEFTDEKEFLQPIEAAQKAAAEIVKQTEKLTKRTPASSVFPDARGDLYLGFDVDELKDPSTSEQMAAAAVQATYAVRLEALPRWLENLAKGPARTMTDEIRILASAPESAKRVIGDLLQKGLLTALDPGLYGLLTVLAMYLEGGKSTTLGDNPKNYVPLLNRAGIHDFVKQASFFGAEAAELLAGEGTRKKLIAFLLNRTQRSAGEPVLLQFDTTPATGEWLEQVLSGTGDSMREFSRFARAKKIPHEEVGPKGERAKAPLFEERQIPGNVVKNRPELIPLERWDKVALEYQQELRKSNTPPSSTSSGKEKETRNKDELKEDLPDLGSVVNQSKSTTQVANASSFSSSASPLQEGENVVVLDKKSGLEVAKGSFVKLVVNVNTYVVVVDSKNKPFKATEYDVVRATG